MSWSDLHQESERLAAEAGLLAAAGSRSAADAKYAEAADFEERALALIDRGRQRTVGIISVSAVSLWFKGKQFKRAEALAMRMSLENLQPYAVAQLRLLLQAVWTEDSKRAAGVSFLPGQIMVSIKGGDVVVGGAPLDLVVDKVQTIQAIFYRTIEFLQGRSFRLRGMPHRDILEACRPWLFQAPPGSYQFSVAVQEPRQLSLLGDRIDPDEVAAKFLDVVKASGDEGAAAITELIPDPQYRTALLKLSRNLSPTGKSFEQLDVRAAGDVSSVSLTPSTRATINETIRASRPPSTDQGAELVTISGTLRAVHLDKDWLEIVTDPDKPALRILGLKDTIDDLIGPMVNRPVRIQAHRVKKRFSFVDIETDE